MAILGSANEAWGPALVVLPPVLNSYHVSSEMTDNWKPYLCNVNGELASIFVNLGLRDSVPMASKRWLLWAWVYFRMPRADGLSDGKEAPTLFKIEDTLNLCVSHACRAILCGRITTEGRREFYFYGEVKDGFPKAVRKALAGFEGYRFDVGAQEDPDWEQYLNVLYPSPEDLQRIANMDLLDVLVEKGDVLTVPREVRHWMYFSSEPSRALFRDAATAAGFMVVSESSTEGKLPFGISVARTQSIEQNSIDRTVLELLNLSRHFDGEYDGWETPVVTQ
jgi:uncharacterized protein (TIGR01619 family)